MTRQTGTIDRNPSNHTDRHMALASPAPALVAAVFLAVAGFASPSLGQAVDGVVVDLSVIGGDGRSAPGLGGAGGKLQLPPTTTPHSRLHVPPGKASAAAPMAETRSQQAAKPMSKPTAKAIEKPAAMAKAKVPAAPPQPISKPAPKAPVKTVAVPPPPKPKLTPKPAPAAKMAAKAPPPPPPPASAMASKAPPPPPSTSTAPPPPAAPAAAENASAPAEIAIKPGRALQIAFSETETKLPQSAEASLNALANGVRDNKDLRLQLMAYAAAKDLSTSKARRISLSRALAVRSFLIDKGVRSTQIDVRALGNKTAESPANRVDVNLAPR